MRGGALATGTTTIVDMWCTIETDGGGVLPSCQIVVPLTTEKKYGPWSVVAEADEAISVASPLCTLGIEPSPRGLTLMTCLWASRSRGEGDVVAAADRTSLAELSFDSGRE